MGGGTVRATGEGRGAGIGGGSNSEGTYIEIQSGIVIAKGGEDASGIGSGYVRGIISRSAAAM